MTHIYMPTTAPPRRRAKPSIPVWGSTVPTQDETNELKRSTIVREAAQCFNKSGFHGTSMDDIAARLHVTKAALYRYVPNKHELLLAAFDMAMDSVFSNIELGEATGTNGLEKIRVALTGYLVDMIGTLGHPVVLLEEGALLPDQAKVIIKRRDEAEKRFRGFLVEGMKDGSVAQCDAKLACFVLLGAVNYVPKWYRPEGAWTPMEVATTLVQLATRCVAAPVPVTHDQAAAGSAGSVD